MTDTDVKVVTKSKIEVTEVPQFYVVMHNDDKTPIDFVIEVLRTIFKLEGQLAVDLTMKIHEEESAIVGMYNEEIAEQKVEDTHQVARANGFPLTASVEQA